MSAFILDDAHINAILQAAAPRYPGDGASYRWYSGEEWVNQPFGGHRQEIGQKLIDENYRSVNHRYGKDSKPHQFRSMPAAKTHSPVELIKLCHCYVYQSSETPDWKQTEAYAIAKCLLERAVHSLDGYSKAAWTVYDE